MAKELAHILIAQDVLLQLKRCGQQHLAKVIEENLPSFYLGAIIPDAFYYDVLPFGLRPQKHAWISRALHLKKKIKNDQKAVGLFRAIAIKSGAWRLKAAFAAGIITHTVVDRIFHELIEYYTTTWGEKGTVATATHREIETLIDIILLRLSNTEPRRFHPGLIIRLDEPTKYTLFHFYLSNLLDLPEANQVVSLVNCLKRAYDQQCLFLTLFATRPLYHIMNMSNRIVKGRLRIWQSLFYPDRVNPESFPVLAKLKLRTMSDENIFFRELKRLRKRAAIEAIQHINTALKTFA